MILRHRVALGSVQLDSVDERVMISRVEVADGKESISAASLAGDTAGSRVTGIHRDSLDVTVKFRIRLKKRDMAERDSVLEAVNAWALPGGWLTTNYKTGRRIRVFLAQAAGEGDPWDWTKEYALVFRACGVPYWQESTATSVTSEGIATGTVQLTVPGSAKGVLNYQFKNTSGSTINNMSIMCTGGYSMIFDGLGLANGETLVADHYDTGKLCYLRLRIKNTSNSYRSVLAKRTGGVGDDLTVSPGAVTVTLDSTGAGNLTVSCFGRFA